MTPRAERDDGERTGAAGSNTPQSSAPSRLGRIRSDPDGQSRFSFGEVLAERYRVLGRIGGGGMGDVYRADDLKLGQPVALKFLPESMTEVPERLARLFSEVRLARQVSHRNVCRVYDIVEHGDLSFLSMEFVDGEDLSSLLRRAGRLAPEKATEMARQICAGLHSAHEQGILHRDLKPANILVDSDGVPHIADFGLAGFDTEIEKHEIRAGTPSYMSPEQVQGREVTTKSDIYALGLLLYEMYTGTRALSGKSRMEIEDRRSQLATSTSTELASLDPAVERAIFRCLETDPALRPANVLAVAASLPGGDPLAAALAAGELPSPEMIAASGSAGTLAPLIGVAALATIVLTFALQLVLAPHALINEIVGLPKSTAVLEDRATELRRSFGYPDSLAAHRAVGWRLDGSALTHEARLNPEAPRWDSLGTGQPAPITFWFRESPSHLVARNLLGHVNATDPPASTPGMVNLRLSARGDLRWWKAVPPDKIPLVRDASDRSETVDEGEGAREGLLAAAEETPDSVSPEAPMGMLSSRGGVAEGTHIDPGRTRIEGTDEGPRLQVESIFLAAGLDFAEFHEIPRDWNPPDFADEMHTYRGRYRDRPGFEIAVQIAGYGGRPTWFEIIEPWGLEVVAGEGRSGSDWTQGILQGMVIVMIVSAALLARRNVRLGQGDRRGAARLGTFAAVTMAGALLLSAHHVPLFQPEWNVINVTIGIGLVLGGLTWLIYIALEPFARRIWPETLISWSRLLQGRIHDPRVGRDLLLGIAIGSLLGVSRAVMVVTLPAVGQPPIPPSMFDVSYLDGFFAFLSTLLVQPLNSVWIPMAILLLAIGIRVLVRKKWAAILVSAGFFFVVLALGVDGPIGIVAVALAVILFVGTLFRLGLLAMMALHLTNTLYGQFPFTANLGAWYAWPSVVTMLGLFLLALHGFRLSRRHA